MQRWISLALLLTLAAVGSYAQNDSLPTIAEVRIAGLERISEQIVRSQLEVQAGQSYSPRAVARDIRRLYELGHFSNIRVDASEVAGGIALTYFFEEKRVIDEIQIIGNEKINDRKVRGVLSWREGDAFLPDGYDSEREAILNLYQEKGYANAAVDIIAEKVGPSRVRITYVVHEGKKARIRSITFVGNDVLSKHRLNKTMKTNKAWWFLGGRYNEEKFEADLESILKAYGEEGRLEAAIPRTEVVYTDDGDGMHITIYLEEGAEYTVGTLEVANNAVYDDDEMESVIEIHEGDVHNRTQVAEDAATIEKGYQDSGYVNTAVTPQVVLDREAKTTSVVHEVDEGDLKYIREITVTGNEVTKDEVIRRQMLLKPGDRFDGSTMKLSQRRLDNTGYFERARLTLGNVPESDLWNDLLVDVEEGKTGTFTFGAGFSTDDGVAGFGEIRLTNVDILNWPTFAGGGQKLTLRLQAGDQRDEYLLSFTDPDIFGYPLQMGFDIYRQSVDYSDGANYDEQQTGAQLRFGKVLSPFVRTDLALLYQSTDISDVPFQFLINPELREITQESTTHSVKWSIERNTVDSQREPSSGSVHSLSLQLAGLGGDNDFYKIEHDSQWYWPLTQEEQWVLSFRTRQGWVDHYGSSDYVPIQDRFFAGGATTIRGYEARDVGPKTRQFLFFGEETAVGGQLRLITNLEVKYRVNDILRIYAFTDAGGVWRDSGDFDMSDMRYSVGLGLGFDVPRLGPFRVDYGIPLNADENQGSGQLHLATGFRF